MSDNSGKIVGAGLLSHAPVIMFPDDFRIQANGGKDFTLATGLKRLKSEVFESVDYETVIVLDTHWETTTEFVVSAQERRSGLFTSSEMPSLLSKVPYDLLGDSELAHAIEKEAMSAEDDKKVWTAAINDANLPIQYATLNLHSYLAQPNKAWISISVCQTATTDDFLNLGQAISSAVQKTDRKVMLIASGGLSHSFHPLAKLRDHMSGDAKNIISEGARKADLERIAWLEAGDHKKVIQTMPEFAEFNPEANFGHYLIMASTLGGESCRLSGERFSEYESGIGTGHVHMWFRS